MTHYFANTFSENGLAYSMPKWDREFKIIIVRGLPQSAVTIFFHDIVADLQIHDIPIDVYLSCVYPDTPEIIVLPSLKRVILNGNNLAPLLKESINDPITDTFLIEELDLTRFCNRELLKHYQKSIDELAEKMLFYQQQGLQLLKMSTQKPLLIGELTREMLLLFQSLFPLTAENTGHPEKVLASAITSLGWVSNVENLTARLKRRYILNGSDNFAKTFFKLAESRVENLNMRCKLFMDPLTPEIVEGILFPAEGQVILAKNKHHSLVRRSEDIELYFRQSDDSIQQLTSYEQNLKLAISSLIKSHSYREEMDEYYWYTIDLDQLFIQRRRLVHSLLALCDGQELWEYFIK